MLSRAHTVCQFEGGKTQVEGGILFSFDSLLLDIASNPVNPVLLLLTGVPYPTKNVIEIRA